MKPFPYNLASKPFRIGLHLACLFVHPIDRVAFHVSGLLREFRFY